MNKYIFLHYGFEMPTEELKQEWMSWFDKIGPSLVDPGNPLMNGRRVGKTDTVDIAPAANPVTGYCIVNAATMEDAEKLLDGCPVVDSIAIYEAASM